MTGIVGEIKRWRNRKGRVQSEIVREGKRSGRLAGAAEISKELAEWRNLQQKSLKNKLGLPNRKG